jgi:hypothetical protein
MNPTDPCPRLSFQFRAQERVKHFPNVVECRNAQMQLAVKGNFLGTLRT